MYSHGTDEPFNLSVGRRQAEPHAQIPKCVDGKSNRSAEVLHHFGLGRTIGFQAAVLDTSGGKHPEYTHRLIIRSRHLPSGVVLHCGTVAVVYIFFSIA